LKEVSIMKSVQNFISYHHKIFSNFSQFLAIYFELFSSRVNSNSKISDMRDPPVSLPLPAPGPPLSMLSPRGCHAPCARAKMAPADSVAVRTPPPLTASPRAPPTAGVQARHAAAALASSPGQRVAPPFFSPLHHRAHLSSAVVFAISPLRHRPV
jgi:hypothetical protein